MEVSIEKVNIRQKSLEDSVYCISGGENTNEIEKIRESKNKKNLSWS